MGIKRGTMLNLPKGETKQNRIDRLMHTPHSRGKVDLIPRGPHIGESGHPLNVRGGFMKRAKEKTK